MTRMTIDNRAITADAVVVRIDQGDYLSERGGYDWGRAEWHEATEYPSVAAAQAAVERLRAPGRAIEAAPNC